MKLLKIGPTITICFVFLFAVGLCNAQIKNPNYDVVVPAVSGIDFSKVEIWVDTRPEYFTILLQYVREQLAKAGIYKPEQARVEKTAKLTVILNPIPLGHACSDKIMYISGIEFEEELTIPRKTGDTYGRAFTWGTRIPYPQARNKMTLEDLKKDADGLVAIFIQSYRAKEVVFPR
ncbi:MAG: hypothetical protein ACYDBV_01365 [Nitrospiria bacterium]